MCEYICTGEDVVEEFEAWLLKQDGEIQAKTIADAWNILAKKYDWEDKLKAIEPKEWKR